MEQQTRAPYGTVIVHLAIDRQGKVINPRITSGPPGKLLRRLAMDAAANTPQKAMPRAVIKELEGKRLAMDVTFDYLPAPGPARNSAPR